MTRGAVLLCGVVTVLLLGACGYRLRSPKPLGEEVQVVVERNRGRIPRSQLYVQQAVADALVQRLGWRVSPLGTARLVIELDEEEIEAGSHGTTDIASSWSITLRGTARMSSRQVFGEYPLRGTGYSTGRLNEPQALERAAANLAAALADTLDLQLNRPEPGLVPAAATSGAGR
jgi:hypothetical protein